jgi:hypothetical protein
MYKTYSCLKIVNLCDKKYEKKLNKNIIKYYKTKKIVYYLMVILLVKNKII